MRTYLVLACVVLVVSGCGGARLSEADQAVLDSFEHQKPEYEMDNNGRVMALKLERRILETSDLREIAKLTELRRLSMYGAKVPDEALAELKDLKRLERVGLGGTEITDRGVDHLMQVPNLRWVWLPKNGKVTDAKIAELKAA